MSVKWEAWSSSPLEASLGKEADFFFFKEKQIHDLLDLINREVHEKFTHRNVYFKGAIRLPEVVNLTPSSSL